MSTDSLLEDTQHLNTDNSIRDSELEITAGMPASKSELRLKPNNYSKILRIPEPRQSTDNKNMNSAPKMPYVSHFIKTHQDKQGTVMKDSRKGTIPNLKIVVDESNSSLGLKSKQNMSCSPVEVNLKTNLLGQLTKAKNINNLLKQQNASQKAKISELTKQVASLKGELEKADSDK